MLVLDDLLLVGVTCWGDLLGTGHRPGGSKSHNRRLAQGVHRRLFGMVNLL